MKPEERQLGIEAGFEWGKAAEKTVVYEDYGVSRGMQLGIEAARNVIISEAADVIKNQGMDIDMRHIVFLADVMTMSGNIKGITRSGITSEKESVLARAIFETSKLPLDRKLTESLFSSTSTIMIPKSVPVIDWIKVLEAYSLAPSGIP